MLHFARSLAEDGRRRCKGCAGSDAALAGEHDAGHLPAVRSRVAASSGGTVDESGAVKEIFRSVLFAIVRKMSQ